MNFIGRESELHKLDLEFQRDHGFVVLYGRRRIGKTTLIKEFVKGKNALYFLATEEIERRNLDRFTQTLAHYSDQEYLAEASFHDWEALFKIFASYKPLEKKVLVIDEFQYLVHVNAAFPSIFQRIWDEILSTTNIMVIICGSYIHMMMSQVLSYSSPLYGRRTAQIKLAPLKFIDLQNNDKEHSFENLVEIYALTGGVPKYLEFFHNHKNIYENMADEILRKGSFLFDEPVFLLEKEVKEVVSYFSIMKGIADGNHKLSELSSTLGLASNAMSPYIKTLINLDLISKRVPITEKNPEKSRKSLYYICDHFIAFWFRFVHTYKGELEMDNVRYVLEQIKKRFVENHVAYVFEEVSKENLATLCMSGQIDFSISRMGSYWNSNCEIDLVAIDEEHKCVILGECKYCSKPVDADVYFDLLKKSETILDLKDYPKFYAIFSKSSFTNRLLDLAKSNSNIVLINCGELVGGGKGRED